MCLPSHPPTFLSRPSLLEALAPAPLPPKLAAAFFSIAESFPPSTTATHGLYFQQCGTPICEFERRETVLAEPARNHCTSPDRASGRTRLLSPPSTETVFELCKWSKMANVMQRFIVSPMKLEWKRFETPSKATTKMKTKHEIIEICQHN